MFAVQQSDIHIYAHFHILIRCGLSWDIKYSSLCHTVGRCCLSILCVMVCVWQSQAPTLSLPLVVSAMATPALFSVSVSLPAFCGEAHLCQIPRISDAMCVCLSLSDLFCFVWNLWVRLCCCKWHCFLPFNGWVIFHCERACVRACVCVRVHAKPLKSCSTLCDLLDCSPPGPSVHGILQARMLEWVALPASGGSADPGVEPASHYVSCITGGFFTSSAIREARESHHGLHISR